MGTVRRDSKIKSARSAAARVAARTEEPPAVQPVPRFWYVLVSVALLIPCFWQPRIEAGDLSSHIYNAWLATRVEAGQLPGLAVVHQSTNILFDSLLSGLLRIVGPALAQKIAVSLAVLLFAWGAFAFVSSVSRRAAWPMLPALAVLGYGWVFHMGFFNFYLSLGLCLAGLALAWNGRRSRIALAAGLFAVAWTAHLLPVLWSAAVLTYGWLAPRLAWRRRLVLLGGYLIFLAVAHWALLRFFNGTWNPRQFLLASGADQAWIFDDKYYLTFAGLAIVWGLALADLLLRSSLLAVVSALPFELCILNAAAVVILPTEASGHGFTASFLADRLSLLVGICVCALLVSARPNAISRYALPAVALLFFAFLFRDQSVLNRFESRMHAAVAGLPPYPRVVNAVYDSGLHIDPLAHMVDRACIGRCYSYANYEPSSGEFRVRALAPNLAVTANYVDSWLLQNGAYRVKPPEAPLYQLDLDETGRFTTRVLKAGEPTLSTDWKVLPDLF